MISKIRKRWWLENEPNSASERCIRLWLILKSSDQVQYFYILFKPGQQIQFSTLAHEPIIDSLATAINHLHPNITAWWIAETLSIVLYIDFPTAGINFISTTLSQITLYIITAWIGFCIFRYILCFREGWLAWSSLNSGFTSKLGHCRCFAQSPFCKPGMHKTPSSFVEW